MATPAATPMDGVGRAALAAAAAAGAGSSCGAAVVVVASWMVVRARRLRGDRCS
jgi:hypothetical protein